MELEDWECLYPDNLSNSQVLEESSVLDHEQAQQQVTTHVVDHQGDVQVPEITEILEELGAAPEVDLQDAEVEFEEGEVTEEENSELEFEKEEEQEVGYVETANENECCENGLNRSAVKWRMRGIGIAAGILSMLLLGGCKRSHNGELQMQVYASDKRMKHAMKLNQVRSVMRGTPATTANISFRGCYQGLQQSKLEE